MSMTESLRDWNEWILRARDPGISPARACAPVSPASAVRFVCNRSASEVGVERAQVALLQFTGVQRQAHAAEQVVVARLRQLELRRVDALLRVEHVELGARAD